MTTPNMVCVRFKTSYCNVILAGGMSSDDQQNIYESCHRMFPMLYRD